MSERWRPAALCALGLLACSGPHEQKVVKTDVQPVTAAESQPSAAVPQQPAPAVPAAEQPAAAAMKKPAVPAAADPQPPSAAVADGEEAAPAGKGSRVDDSRCRMDGARVPDGKWYGAIRSADPQQISFDVMCWFDNEEANRAAAEDGETEIPVPNDYYVRNRSTRERKVQVDAAAQVEWLAHPPDHETIAYARWLAERNKPEAAKPGVTITVEAGRVTRIRERYTP